MFHFLWKLCCPQPNLSLRLSSVCEYYAEKGTQQRLIPTSGKGSDSWAQQKLTFCCAWMLEKAEQHW